MSQIPKDIVTGNKWIEIKKGCKMPRASTKIDAVEYLILIMGKFYAIARYVKGFNGQYASDEDKKTAFKIYRNGRLNTYSRVTHWMPLPPLPKPSTNA